MRHKNLSIALNKTHASRESSSLKNFICKGKYSQTERVKNAINRFKKQKLRCGPLALAALQFYCVDNGYKMQTSFKTLVSKNTATWQFHQTSG